MPSGPLTFVDLQKFQGGAEAAPLLDIIEENVRKNPELKHFPAVTMEGRSIELTVRTDLPTVNFVNIGEGVAESKSGYITRLFRNANLDALVKYPVNMLTGIGAATGARLMESERAGFIEAAIRKIGQQTWYGVGAPTDKGFIGIIAQMLTDSNHVIDAGGTASGVSSSVFFTTVGQNKQQYWFGNNQAMAFDEWYRNTVKDGNGLDLDAMCSWLHCTPGFRLEDRNSTLRIKGLDTSSHKLTHSLMYQALQTMRETLQTDPDYIWMTSRSLEQLRQELLTDLNPAPPLPKDLDGIPIITTPNLSNTETI